MTDGELVRRAQRGERRAFDQLILRRQPIALSLAIRIVGDRERGLELTQEAVGLDIPADMEVVSPEERHEENHITNHKDLDPAQIRLHLNHGITQPPRIVAQNINFIPPLLSIFLQPLHLALQRA